MDDISSRMGSITEELRGVQQRLQQLLLDGPVGPETIGKPEEQVSIGQVRDFKATLDLMRHFLWFFLQAASEDDSGEKLIELLRQAARCADDPSMPTLEQMNNSTDYAILHYPIPPNRKPN